jgi:hypothetical protein
MANAQISPGNAHPPSPLCPPHLRPRLPYRYWTLKIIAFSSDATASHAISVRRARVLPAASFRFHLAMDTLAVRLTLPPVGCVEDFHLQVSAPCRAHNQKRPGSSCSPAFSDDRKGVINSSCCVAPPGPGQAVRRREEAWWPVRGQAPPRYPGRIEPTCCRPHLQASHSSPCPLPTD